MLYGISIPMESVHYNPAMLIGYERSTPLPDSYRMIKLTNSILGGMDPETFALVTEIDGIQHVLNEAHDVDWDYLPPPVRDMRNYVFQVHASFEQSMQLVITYHHLKRPYTSHSLLLEQITFEGKMKIVAADAPLFPLREAKKLNLLRNELAHKAGERLRQAYDDQTRLKVYRFLKRSNARLNEFWTPLQRATGPAVNHIA